MNTSGKTSLKSYTIPMDVYMDALRILLSVRIPNRVEALNEKQNSLILRLEIKTGDLIHQQALENLESILSNYGYFLNGCANSDFEEDY